jgi:hypothetical protein
MELVISILGALGAWLLVAGPVYQAALELREQDIDRAGIDAATAGIPKPAGFSPWWWLLPPVAYYKSQKRGRAYRQATMDALGPEQLKQSVDFLNKARGWLIIASGAFFIAIKETWEVSEILHWPSWLMWVVVVVLVIVSIGYTAGSIATSEHLLRKDEDASRHRRRVNGRTHDDIHNG